ncbi:hypothetical protein SAMN05720468_10868 [Fibrobacter sp. UWEL]|nr:hypothetical protein SAMN05720468_10868 [Fibrobacter sp. UWEL]
MRRATLIIMVLMMLLSAEVFARRAPEHTQDFAGIAFGSSRETVIEEVMKMGYQPYGQSGKEGERVVVPIFKFGELPVQVDFIFNSNEKFSSFEIRTGRVERSRMSKAFEAVEYMSDQFTLKYGKPNSNPRIDEESNLKEGVRNFYLEWLSVSTLDINTAVVQIEGRYFAVGTVTHRLLSNEKVKSAAPAKAKASNAPVF